MTNANNDDGEFGMPQTVEDMYIPSGLRIPPRPEDNPFNKRNCSTFYILY